MSSDKVRLNYKVTEQERTQFKELADKLGYTMTDLVKIALNEYTQKQSDLLVINQVNNNKKRNMINNALSIVDTYERNVKVRLPEQLVNYNELDNSVVLERVSSVLSLNKTKEAYKFAMGLINIIDGLEENSKIVFTETDTKGRISTKLVRNLFGNAIVFTLISAIDRGHTIYTFDGEYHQMYVEDLFALLSEGITTSIHERTKVYDNLFYSAYNKAHFNQWLQWTFALSRREPLKEFNRLLRKNPKITKPTETKDEKGKIIIASTELDDRLTQAIKNLKERYTLFGLSSEGLELAINKMTEFVRLYKNYAGDYDATKKCKNANIHELLQANNEKCPLKCGI